MFIHSLADVQTSSIGKGTTIWQFAVVLKGATIGANCNINCHTFIENDVIIGDNVTVKSGTYIWDSIRIEDDVFIGPNVVFTNDLRPRSKQRVNYPGTLIQKGASLGANSTILAGIVIGRYSMTGAGSVVTRDVPDFGLVYGNPAKLHGWIDETGKTMQPAGDRLWRTDDGRLFKEVNRRLELQH